MSATSFGIIYATESKMVLVIIVPDRDSELRNLSLRPGTSLLIAPNDGPSDVFSCEKLVEAATGVKPLASRHAVIDERDNVVAVDHIEPTLDGPVIHPGKRLVQSHSARIGMVHHPIHGFSRPTP